MSSPCLARLLWKPQVKNAFGVADAAGQTVLGIHARRASRLACVARNPGEMPLLYHHRSPCTYIIYTSKGREGEAAGGGWGYRATGSSRPIAFGHVERQIWQYEGSSCHSGLWWLHAETPLRHADRQGKDPTLPLHLRSQAEYRRNRNKAESLSTLEVHWSKTLA